MGLRVRSVCILAAWFFTALTGAVRVEAQSSVISYQGRLSESGQPANGTYDFRFSLFNAESAGAEVGTPILVEDLVVSGGMFSVLLDFGAAPFDGSPRWLDVAVRSGGSTTAYISLTPRQPISSTPYAIRALSASSLQGNGIVTFPMLDSSAVTQLQQPAAALQNQLFKGNNVFAGSNHVAGPFVAPSLANQIAGRFSGSFAGDGSGLTNVASTAGTSFLFEAERAARAAALAKALVDLLAGTNRWTGSNFSAGPFIASHPGNVFGGRFVGDGSGLTNLPTASLASMIEAERAARAADIARALNELLNGNNRWTGSNYVSGTLMATNKDSRFQGQFAGAFTGDGSGLTAIPATNIAGKLAAASLPDLDAAKTTAGVFADSRIPNLDAAKVTTGVFSDARISPAFVKQTELLSVSNQFTARLSSTNAVLSAGLDAEKSARVAALAQALADLYGGTNLWTGSNNFSGTVTATNPNNRFQGGFAGDGAAVTNLQATNVSGVLANATVPASRVSGELTAENIPLLNGSKLGAGIIPDARMSTNIARMSDLTQLNQLLYGAILENSPVGLTVVSASAEDTLLTGRGYALFTSLPSPPWSNGPTTDAPSARSRHAAVWTGEELIIWGGFLGAGVSSASGSRFSPGVGTWLALPAFGAPSARESHTAVWSGAEMIVWGGLNSSGIFQNSGAKLKLSTQTWSPVQTTGVPSARANHVAVWTGSRMVIWGGRNATGYLNDGSLYDPEANVWAALPSSGSPEARHSSRALWARDRVLVWGGDGVLGEINTGGQVIFNAEKFPQAWTAISTAGAPGPRTGHTLIWTGSRMIVWGGKQGGSYLNDGAVYDPVLDNWKSLSSTGAPTVRANHSAVWTGKEMLIYGGENGSTVLASGALYDPAIDKWQTITAGGGPVARSESTGFWTGSEFLIFGGQSNGQVLSSLQRVSPQPTWYFYRKP